MKLINLIKETKRLTEEVIEPSEQIIKGVQKELKAKTGIITTLSPGKKSRTGIKYTSDLSKEIRTAVLRSVFSTMTLDVYCTPIPGSIGGYSFSVSIDYTHPRGGSNGVDIGTIFYENNRFKSRFTQMPA
jgi:hypothetical protein